MNYKHKHAFSFSLFFMLSCLLFSTSWAFDISSIGSKEPEFLKVDEAFKVSAEELDGEVIVRWVMADEYYLYKHRMSIAAETGEIVPVVFPAGKPKVDEYFGNVEIYTHLLEIPVTVKSHDGVVKLKVGYQGCTEGLCYPPKKKSLEVKVSNPSNTQSSGASLSADKVESPSQPSDLTKKKASEPVNPTSQSSSPLWDLKNSLNQGKIPLIVIGFYLMGLILSFTPCVYPMYPILLSIIAGQGKSISKSQSFTLSMAYVQGICLSYAALGIAIGGLGFNVSSIFQQPSFVIPVVALLLVLSLSMFGFYELQLPGFLRDRLHSVSEQQKGGTYLGVFIMGVISTLVLSPCTAAPLITAFGYIASTGDRAIGGLSLYALGFGMGTPLIILGVIGGQVMPKAGGWMNAIKAAFGIAIIGVALRLADPLIPGPIYLLLWASLLMCSALYMGIFVWPSKTSWQTFWKGIGFVFFIYGIALILGAAMGNGKLTKPLEGLNSGDAYVKTASESSKSSGHGDFQLIESQQALENALAAAAQRGQPVMVDFFADWCTACFELADYTFVAPQVKEALKGTLLLKVDISESSAANRNIEKDYGILGLPMILFYDKQGNELKDFRVSGFMPAEEFSAHVKKALR